MMASAVPSRNVRGVSESFSRSVPRPSYPAASTRTRTMPSRPSMSVMTVTSSMKVDGTE